MNIAILSIVFSVCAVLNLSEANPVPSRYSTAKPGQLLSGELNKINRKLDDINYDLGSVKSRLSHLEYTSKNDNVSVEKKITKVEKSVTNLQEVNEVWKKNFLSIKDTFSRIKQKVNYYFIPRT